MAHHNIVSLRRDLEAILSIPETASGASRQARSAESAWKMRAALIAGATTFAILSSVLLVTYQRSDMREKAIASRVTFAAPFPNTSHPYAPEKSIRFEKKSLAPIRNRDTDMAHNHSPPDPKRALPRSLDRKKNVERQNDIFAPNSAAAVLLKTLAERDRPRHETGDPLRASSPTVNAKVARASLIIDAKEAKLSKPSSKK